MTNLKSFRKIETYLKEVHGFLVSTRTIKSGRNNKLLIFNHFLTNCLNTCVNLIGMTEKKLEKN